MKTSEFTIPLPYKTDRRTPVRWLLSHIANQWLVIAISLIGAIGNAVLASTLFVYTGQAFDLVAKGGEIAQPLLRIALVAALVQTIRILLQFARNFGFEYTAQRMERYVRNELYTELLGKSMTFHSLQPVGDIMARATNDVKEVNFMFSPGLNMVLGSLVFLIVPFFVIPRYHMQLLLVPGLFAIAYFIALRYYMRSLTPLTNKVREDFGVMNMRLNESLEGLETVKGSAQEDFENELYRQNMQEYADSMIKQGYTEAKFLPILLLGVATALAFTHAMILFNQGQITRGDVIAYLGLMFMLEFPTFASMFAYSRISLGFAGARRILDVMNRENDLDQNKAGYSGKMRGKVEFRDVCFSYNEGEPIIEHVNFVAQPGQTIAVVGQTGSAKTTLVRLINRTYDIQCGQILVDDVDVRDWNLESLRQQISIIEQDIFLFSESIRENIAFGKPGATEEEIHAAAVSAQADEFIEQMEEGYDTMIGERGVTLSGGQRQRLALSRAFLTDPRILVLDDSTSAIDSATEDKIQRAINKAAEGRTTFIITHRLSQIRWADLILVMREGKLAAAGSHQELMDTTPFYRRIFSE
ncbi:MAG TPA: ABC transporter ATP-binding protein [Bellilinea sp.]|nr:ABC transporter ATP-binding protein [Bellilinea sp.]